MVPFYKNKELWTELGPASCYRQNRLQRQFYVRSKSCSKNSIPAQSYGGWDSKIGRVCLTLFSILQENRRQQRDNELASSVC